MKRRLKILFMSSSVAVSTYKQWQSLLAQVHARLVKTDSAPGHCEASSIKDDVPSGYGYKSGPLASFTSSHTYKKGKRAF